MKAVIHHLIKTPEWISLIIFFACLFAFIYEDENIIQVKFGYNEEDLFYSNHKEILLNINKKDENITNE